MKIDTKEMLHDILREIAALDYIKPDSIPNIDLYMDQVTTFMDEHLANSRRHSEDKILTKTMINNYAKNHLLPSPQKKKYSKEHMLLLIFIYYFKGILSISDIHTLLGPLTDQFFSQEEGLTLKDIYNEVFGLERTQMEHLILFRNSSCHRPPSRMPPETSRKSFSSFLLSACSALMFI